MESNIYKLDLLFLMGAVSANFTDFNYKSKLTAWQYEEPFIRIRTEKLDSISPEFYNVVKKSNRGRKPKKKTTVKTFPSNISFFMNHFHHTDKFNVKYSVCHEHANCYVKKKKYNIRIFNGGQIVCVGLKCEKALDFIECVSYISKFLTKQDLILLLLCLREYKLPKEFYFTLSEYLKLKYQINNLKSTLRNYQFDIETPIDLFKLQNFFSISTDKLLNIDKDKFLSFICSKIKDNNYELDAEVIVKLFNQKSEIIKDYIIKDAFIILLNTWDLKKISLDFQKIYNEFYDNYKFKSVYWDKFQANLRFNFVKYQFNKHHKKLHLLDASTVTCVLPQEKKNTLMISKQIEGKDITIKVFGTGVISIQGANCRITCEKIAHQILHVFTLVNVFYNKNNPPMLTLEQILN